MAAAEQIKKLSGYTVEQCVASLRASIANDYQGVFPENVKLGGVQAQRQIAEQKTSDRHEQLKDWLAKDEDGGGGEE